MNERTIGLVILMVCWAVGIGSGVLIIRWYLKSAQAREMAKRIPCPKCKVTSGKLIHSEQVGTQRGEFDGEGRPSYPIYEITYKCERCKHTWTVKAGGK